MVNIRNLVETALFGENTTDNSHHHFDQDDGHMKTSHPMANHIMSLGFKHSDAPPGFYHHQATGKASEAVHSKILSHLQSNGFYHDKKNPGNSEGVSVHIHPGAGLLAKVHHGKDGTGFEMDNVDTK